MAEWQTAGKVRMTPKGTWSGLVPYEILDCVLSPDNLKYYVAKQPVPANTALTNTDYWDVMSNMQDIADTVNDAADELDNNMSSLVIAQDEEPEEAFNKVWFDTSSNEEYTLPEINDNTVSATDTWSSQKIRNEIDAGDAELKSAFNTFVDERNLFWNAPLVSGKYYYGGEMSLSSFGYFIVPVVSEESYTFGCNVRFLSSESAGIDNTEHGPGYQYEATFTGDLYVTVRLDQADSFVMCKSDYDVTQVGTTAQPRLSQNLLAQESGNSESLAMSQAGVGNAISAVAVMRDGEGQVKPQNIEGVTVTGGNILDDAERIYCSQSGYVGGDGYVVISDSKAFIQTGSSFCSFLIAVKPNTHYTANNEIRFAVLLKNLATEGTRPVQYTTVVGSALANISSFDTGEADHIIVSWSYSSYPINTFVISKGNTASADIHVSLPDWWTDNLPLTPVKGKSKSVTGSLSDGSALIVQGCRNNIRKGERVVFYGNISSFNSISFGISVSESSLSAGTRNTFTIDGTNITYTESPYHTPVVVQHGLTIADNIQIVGEEGDTGTYKISIISGGLLFAHEFNYTQMLIGAPYVSSSGSIISDAKLTWTCTDIDRQIWMFGDSYFAYSPDRWTYYLHEYGYDKNCLIDGWPGMGSTNARVSFVNMLTYGTPRFAVWCMGMNDGGDSGATPSTDWSTQRDIFLQYCNENEVTPVFATIPTVPSVNNEAKNAWVRSSGYRYIDFALAVGATSSGAWYSGMLSSDNVHPTEKGAKALFARFLVDFPEIMVAQ